MRAQNISVIDLLKPVLSVLKEKDNLACLIGEIALNYYNVPRVVHVSIHIYHNVISESRSHG